MKPTAYLKEWISKNPGPWQIGQISVHPGHTLFHRDDQEKIDSLLHLDLEKLTDLVKTNAQGDFRPLRASPDLSRGWILKNLSFEQLVEALRILYPAALSHWSDWQQNQLHPIPYLETAERQTGMYHCARLLSPEQRSQLILNVCGKDCLKRRLWEPADSIAPTTHEIPLLCTEACNFFIAKAREVVKSMNPGS